MQEGRVILAAAALFPSRRVTGLEHGRSCASFCQELVEPLLVFVGQGDGFLVGVDEFVTAGVGAAVECERFAQKALCNNTFASDFSLRARATAAPAAATDRCG